MLYRPTLSLYLPFDGFRFDPLRNRRLIVPYKPRQNRKDLCLTPFYLKFRVPPSQPLKIVAT